MLMLISWGKLRDGINTEGESWESADGRGLVRCGNLTPQG
jgi:hypothetical protein